MEWLKEACCVYGDGTSRTLEALSKGQKARSALLLLLFDTRRGAAHG